MNRTSCITLQKSTGRNESYTSCVYMAPIKMCRDCWTNCRCKKVNQLWTSMSAVTEATVDFSSLILHRTKQTQLHIKRSVATRVRRYFILQIKNKNKNKQIWLVYAYIWLSLKTHRTDQEPGRLLSKHCDEQTAQERRAHAPLNNRFPLFLR